MVNEPKNLFFSGAEIYFEFIKNTNDLATDRAIIVRCNREGFLALANVILYYIVHAVDLFKINLFFSAVYLN